MLSPETSLPRELALHKAGKMVDTFDHLSAEELAAIEARLKKLDIVLDRGVVAKYKLEVHFGKNRTCRGTPFQGVMQYWKSGTHFHGGGDERVWECPKCEKIIDPENTGFGVVNQGGVPKEIDTRLCSRCGIAWPASEVVEFRFFRLTEQNWAYALLKGFQRLDLNADILLKYHREDIRAKTMLELAKHQGDEAVYQARRNRGLHIYPLKNIIVDTRNGAGLYDQIRKFINA